MFFEYLEMRDEGKKRRRSTAIPESNQDLPSEKKLKGKHHKYLIKILDFCV